MKKHVLSIGLSLLLCFIFIAGIQGETAYAASKQETIFRNYCFAKMFGGTQYEELGSNAKAPAKDIHNYILTSGALSKYAGGKVAFKTYMDTVKKHFANPCSEKSMKTYLSNEKLLSNNKVKIDYLYGFGDVVSPYYFSHGKAGLQTNIKGGWLNGMYEKKSWHVKDVDYKSIQATYDTGKKVWEKFGVEKFVTLVLDKNGKIKSYQITKIPLKDTAVSVSNCTYNKNAQKPTVTVKYKGNKLSVDKHYSVTYSNNTYPGTGKVKITGKGKLSGTLNKTFTINKRNITGNDMSISLSQKTFKYDGKKKEPKVTVKHGSTKLTEDKHFTCTYVFNKYPDDASSVTVVGKGNYTGRKTIYFDIEKGEQNPSYVKSIEKNYNDIGDKIDLKVDNLKQPLQAKVTYSTSNSKVATVSKGVVKIAGTGKAKITIKISATKYYAAKKLTVPVTVLKKQTISLKQDKFEYSSSLLNIGAAAKDNAGLTYKSSKTSVAKITAGKLSTKGVGKTTITVTAKKTDEYASATKKFTIYVVPKITANNFNKKTTDAAFNVNAKVNAGSNVVKFKYVSSDTSIATVDSKGLVTLKGKEGTVKITIKTNNVDLFPEVEKVITVNVASFTARKTLPPLTHPSYVAAVGAGFGNNNGAGVYGNCTWYAWGRAHEILGKNPVFTGDAKEWWKYKSSYAGYSSDITKAKPGAIIVWGTSGYSGPGHVAVVEEVLSDGSIVISESSYGGLWYTNRGYRNDKLGAGVVYNYYISEPNQTYWGTAKYTPSALAAKKDGAGANMGFVGYIYLR